MEQEENTMTSLSINYYAATAPSLLPLRLQIEGELDLSILRLISVSFSLRARLI